MKNNYTLLLRKLRVCYQELKIKLFFSLCNAKEFLITMLFYDVFRWKKMHRVDLQVYFFTLIATEREKFASGKNPTAMANNNLRNFYRSKS